MSRAALSGAITILALAVGAVAGDLTLDEALRGVVQNNPDIRARRARWEALKERPAREGALPDPMFTFGGMDATDGGTWPDTSEKRFMVEQEFPSPGKRGLRRALAREEADAAQRDLETLIQDVVRQVRETFFELQAVREVGRLTRDEEDVLRRMQAIAETLYTAGKRSQADLLEAQSELTLLKQKQLELGARETSLKARLHTLLGRPADAPLTLVPAAPPEGPETEPALLQALAEKERPEIGSAESRIRQSEMERALMKKEAWPDLRLGLEYRDLPEENMMMFTVGVDLPIWRAKYRAGVREAEKMIESDRAGLEAVRQQVAFDVEDAQVKLLAARRARDLYRDELIPQAEARRAVREAGYRAGQVDFMDFLESERFLLEARILAAMAEGQMGMEAARLDWASGKRPEEFSPETPP